MTHPEIFTPDTLTFLRTLKQNNSRDWFNDNKAWYETAWKAPAQTFIGAMCFRLQAATDTPHSAKLFRIHRDIRFSKDKTPYNTHLHILFTREGSKAGLFFGLNTQRLVLGAGMMGFDKGQLTAYRDRVAGSEGAALQTALRQRLEAGARLNAPDLVRVPKPFDADHPRADLLRRKGLTLWQDFDDPDIAHDPDLLDICARTFAASQGVCDWLNQHIPTASQRRA